MSSRQRHCGWRCWAILHICQLSIFADLTTAAHNLGLAVEVIEVRRQEEIVELSSDERAQPVPTLSMSSPRRSSSTRLTSSPRRQSTLGCQQSVRGAKWPKPDALQVTAHRWWKPSGRLECRSPASCMAPEWPRFGRTVHTLRADAQPQDRQGPRSDGFTFTARQRRRGDRMMFPMTAVCHLRT